MTYDPKPQEFMGSLRSKFFWWYFTTFANLFDLFWPISILLAIIVETNHYATMVNIDGKTYGGPQWEPISLEELKTFIAIVLYVGMKRQPNVKTYWHKKGSIFHCPTISSLMSHNRYQLFTRCLHITNPSTYVRDKTMPGYNKMGQVRWLINAIHKNCMKSWNVGKFVTIDEMMICYKGTYCLARQYMPQKPLKWGLKV